MVPHPCQATYLVHILVQPPDRRPVSPAHANLGSIRSHVRRILWTLSVRSTFADRVPSMPSRYRIGALMLDCPSHPSYVSTLAPARLPRVASPPLRVVLGHPTCICTFVSWRRFPHSSSQRNLSRYFVRARIRAVIDLAGHYSEYSRGKEQRSWSCEKTGKKRIRVGSSHDGGGNAPGR